MFCLLKMAPSNLTYFSYLNDGEVTKWGKLKWMSSQESYSVYHWKHVISTNNVIIQ